jgi:DNA-3-methyladenine glycosylase II
MNSDYERRYRFLADRDPVLARLVEEYGHPDPFEWHDGGRTGSSNFAAMTLHIVGQQISAVVAFVVFDRIAAAAGGIPTPDGVIALGAERLRECGLSRAKTDYVLDLARRQVSGLIDIEDMADLDDTAAIAALTAVKGIGLWSAQTFLIHQLHRSDILPAGDVASAAPSARRGNARICLPWRMWGLERRRFLLDLEEPAERKDARLF